MSLYTCTTTPFWLLGYISLKIISKNKINIIRHDHQWPSISKNPSPRISRVWQNPRDSKHIQDRQCTEIYWDIKSYTTEHPTLGSSPETQGSSPEMFYDKHKRQYWKYWSPDGLILPCLLFLTIASPFSNPLAIFSLHFLIFSLYLLSIFYLGLFTYYVSWDRGGDSANAGTAGHSQV